MVKMKRSHFWGYSARDPFHEARDPRRRDSVRAAEMIKIIELSRESSGIAREQCQIQGKRSYVALLRLTGVAQ